ncbi:UDP-N-acetylmuramoylalanyl-D-glutamyl-2,6-diaminopimelate--D-alanyl-D-alanine ligase [Siculibacillus lacustris]|uniref:UDP-N-acetylmuramoyl-tripeptide--D-alanyl-D-alanine ligase n=1 Tax=Siculibacillus lacustris TaxID=1549641 RepID=A0A4Q9VUA2_9HYPH|nr:UDP-N-acetylmuramoylalanyl-D-glutamyl-2,6-diaminopimelate--D-alanyl-D-alanine ligase [Siculibacillus lacustris]TBW38713.1 UDP-N-acetylmuramoylalanyl-D-glutamyl-2,6-diaminopimelate--D-alanyl-D-alanine ligase [Siculibacillus lacustris]
MTAALWTLDALVAATGGRVVGSPRAEVHGISIDSRTIDSDEAFFAILGDSRDGHDFVPAALERGAALAVVAEARLAELPADGRYLVVDDVLEALRAIGRAARARTNARIVAVTGSVGKTSTKEALRHVLSEQGKTHASVASYNNHWGVPLTLARMPADCAFGIFEIGMNHAGEITPLAHLVRPHVAVVTTVAPVHLEFFRDVDAIAEAKAEIFDGLEPGGAAVIDGDIDQTPILVEAALAHGARVVRFGRTPACETHVVQMSLQAESSTVMADVLGHALTYKIGAPGRHVVRNSLAVLSCVVLVGADLARAGLALAAMTPPKGRGERHVLHLGHGEAMLIDESYNANPASMRAAIDLLGHADVGLKGRRIAVLGDMLELGSRGERLHAELAGVLAAARIDRCYLAGPLMHALWHELPPDMQGAHAATAKEIEATLLAAVQPGDAIMVKGSFGSRMGPIVEALKARYSSTRAKSDDL